MHAIVGNLGASWLYLVIRLFACGIALPGQWTPPVLLFRGSLAGLIATILTITHPGPPPVGDAGLAVQIVQEFVLGLAWGLALSAVWGITTFVGTVVWPSQEPGSESILSDTNPLRTLLHLVLIASCFGFGLDRIVVGQLLAAIHRFPPGGTHVTSDGMLSLMAIFAACFRAALLVALPLVAANLTAQGIVCILSRCSPAIWSQGLGPSLQHVAFLAILVVMVNGIAWLLRDQLDAILHGMEQGWSVIP